MTFKSIQFHYLYPFDYRFLIIKFYRFLFLSCPLQNGMISLKLWTEVYTVTQQQVR